eukprot:CAMPEP_0171358010 /NCGR_PEP_ID=MMETSP0878-20121228/46533_1 /TAXON_ID=67004 /ORGANISM="Thalassiosira weissflogii, Strain CCMP1336" /LENGTH=1416 /DNA_ID=CAMNT_0011864067 /DNA_START=143 /DNA_END=4393 /DNA_ORIENTATION=+
MNDTAAAAATPINNTTSQTAPTASSNLGIHAPAHSSVSITTTNGIISLDNTPLHDLSEIPDRHFDELWNYFVKEAEEKGNTPASYASYNNRILAGDGVGGGDGAAKEPPPMTDPVPSRPRPARSRSRNNNLGNHHHPRTRHVALNPPRNTSVAAAAAPTGVVGGAAEGAPAAAGVKPMKTRGHPAFHNDNDHTKHGGVRRSNSNQGGGIGEGIKGKGKSGSAMANNEGNGVRSRRRHSHAVVQSRKEKATLMKEPSDLVSSDSDSDDGSDVSSESGSSGSESSSSSSSSNEEQGGRSNSNGPTAKKNAKSGVRRISAGAAPSRHITKSRSGSAIDQLYDVPQARGHEKGERNTTGGAGGDRDRTGSVAHKTDRSRSSRRGSTDRRRGSSAAANNNGRGSAVRDNSAGPRRKSGSALDMLRSSMLVNEEDDSSDEEDPMVVFKELSRGGNDAEGGRRRSAGDHSKPKRRKSGSALDASRKNSIRNDDGDTDDLMDLSKSKDRGTQNDGSVNERRGSAFDESAVGSKSASSLDVMYAAMDLEIDDGDHVDDLMNFLKQKVANGKRGSSCNGEISESAGAGSAPGSSAPGSKSGAALEDIMNAHDTESGDDDDDSLMNILKQDKTGGIASGDNDNVVDEDTLKPRRKSGSALDTLCSTLTGEDDQDVHDENRRSSADACAIYSQTLLRRGHSNGDPRNRQERAPLPYHSSEAQPSAATNLSALSSFMRSPTRSTVDTIVSDFSSIDLERNGPKPDPDEYKVPQYDPVMLTNRTRRDRLTQLGIPSKEHGSGDGWMSLVANSTGVAQSHPNEPASKSNTNSSEIIPQVSKSEKGSDDEKRKPSSSWKKMGANVPSLLTKIEMQREAAEYMLGLMGKVDCSSFHASENSYDEQGSRSNNHQDEPPFRLPTTTTITARKRSKDQLTGLILSLTGGNEIGTVMVKDMTPTSIFSNTDLKSGHEILAINDHRVKCPQRAAKIMRGLVGEIKLFVSDGERPPGTKYIRVRRSTKFVRGQSKSASTGLNGLDSLALVVKNEEEESDIGIHFESVQGMVRIGNVDPHGIFSNSSVYVGDIVLSINGIPTRNEDQARKLILGMDDLEGSGVSNQSGLICMLIYSMVDLRVGLVDQFLPSSWKKNWNENFGEVTIDGSFNDTKGREDQDYDGPLKEKNFEFTLNFRSDWVCQCIDPFQQFDHENESPEEKEKWTKMFDEEIQPIVNKMNEAIATATKVTKEASEASVAPASAAPLSSSSISSSPTSAKPQPHPASTVRATKTLELPMSTTSRKNEGNKNSVDLAYDDEPELNPLRISNDENRKKKRQKERNALETRQAKKDSHSTQPTDDTDDETNSSNVSEQSDVIPVQSVPVAEGATPSGTVRKEMFLLQQKYHPKKVELVDTYEDSIYVHMIIRVVDEDSSESESE